MNEWYVDSSPGTTINTPPSMCGLLVPSVGVSGSGAIAASTWGPNPPDTPLIAAGTTIPPAPYPQAFVALNEAPYFNGYSLLGSLFATPASIGSFSFSAWFANVGSGGAYFSTPITAIPGNAVGQVQLAPGNNAFALVDNTQAYTAGNNIAIVVSPGWFHLMFSLNYVSSGTYNIQIYVNDTAVVNSGNLGSTTSTVNLNGLALGSASVLSQPGGSRHIQSTNGNTFWEVAGGQLPTEGQGFVGGVAEVFWDDTYIDWSNSANRQLFHAKDLVALRYAPVSLGKQGQIPLGHTPKLYLSGTPKNFRFNRATGRQIFTYNIGGNSLFTSEIDPSLVTLDPLPATISPLT